MKLSTSLKKNQSGLVSISVTMVIMIVVVLVVSSFALIVRREQQRSLDRQLSTQAFYAAEAGINDARTAIDRGEISGNINDCSGFQSQTNSINRGGNYQSTLQDNVSYSCVLIDQQPTHVRTDSLTPEDGPIVYAVKASELNKRINKIRISWKDRDNSVDFPFANSKEYDLPYNGLKVPMLRVTILPGFGDTTSTAKITSDEFKNNAQTMFLYPYSNGSTNQVQTVEYNGLIPPTDNNQGRFVSGECNKDNNGVSDAYPLHCNVDIQTKDNRDSYYLVVQSLYRKSTIDIAPYDDRGNALPQKDSQAVIDVTGKASDVLRRVQVRVPIREGAEIRTMGGILPLGPLTTSEKICKKLKIAKASIIDECENQTYTPPQLPPPPDPVGDGDALIGGYTPVSPPSKNEPKFNFQGDFKNKSAIADQKTLKSCTWDWGDGSAPSTYNGDSVQCKGNGVGKVSHMYPDTSKLIESTKGADGCRKYSVKLTNVFYGLNPKTDVYIYELPRGQANDPPNPVTGKGICYGRFKPYKP